MLANELRAEGRGSPPGLSTGKGVSSLCVLLCCVECEGVTIKMGNQTMVVAWISELLGPAADSLGAKSKLFLCEATEILVCLLLQHNLAEAD